MDRPILFSAPMVRALIEGRKTQTRRIASPVSGAAKEGDILVSWPAGEFLREGTLFRPRFQIGDRLWVKETWRTHKSWDADKPSDVLACSRVWYEADRDNCDQHGKVRVSIFMPRWASRLTLTVTDVRVQRLQECSEEDAFAEGISRSSDIEHGVFGMRESWREHHCAYAAYRHLWNIINDAPGKCWADNPWVVAVSFTVDRRNIDQVPA
jgi:uncharacterized protein YhfF